MLDKIKTKNVQSKIKEIADLAVESFDNYREIVKKIYLVLQNDEYFNGELVKRKSDLLEMLRDIYPKLKSSSQLRRYISQAVLEVELGLEPCTLNEFQARTILEVKGLSGQKKVYQMAKKIAKKAGEKLTSVYIKQAIEEYNIAKNKNMESETKEVDDVVKDESTDQSTPKNSKAINRFKSNEMDDDAEVKDEIENDGFNDIESTSLKECRTDEIYHKIKPQLKSDMDFRVFRQICNGSEGLWKAIKILAEYEKCQLNINRLMEMLDEKLKTKKSRQKSPSRGKKRVFGKPPIKKLILD